MVDSSKRRSLKSLGVLITGPILPAIAVPATSKAKQNNAELPISKASGNEELGITLFLSDKPMMRVTNKSDTLSILRRLQPGVVHAGNRAYDLNHALASSSYAIGAGLSRLVPIAEANGSSANYEHYSRFKYKPLGLASITANNADGRILNSARIFFA